MKHLIMAPVLVFLALAQQSFLNQFSIMGTAPNFVFIASFILIFFSCLQKPGKFYHNYQGIFFRCIFSLLFWRSYIGFIIGVYDYQRYHRITKANTRPLPFHLFYLDIYSLFYFL